MSQGDFWKVSVLVRPEAEEAVSGLLEELFAQCPCVYTDADTLATEVSVYLAARRKLAPRQIKPLRERLRRMHAAGPGAGPARARVRFVRRQDWAEAWKRHFKPLDIGGRLLVKPSWSRRKPKAGQEVVTLDPGLSFGTGQHPTTAYCLRELARTRRTGCAQSFLDIGTGSGLLAIAAAKLGYAPVEAFDNDPEAVRAAGGNLALNGVTGRVALAQRSLEKLPRRTANRFDVVCANLLAELLIAQRERIAARVAPGGTLVVAGILQRDFAAVRAAYEAAGLRLKRSCREREWKSGTFVAC